MLFNLTKKNKYTVQRSSIATCCSDISGPEFGWSPELGAVNDPFNGNNACLSSVNREGYKIPKGEDDTNMLTYEKCNSDGYCYFTIVEIEVWEVVF